MEIEVLGTGCPSCTEVEKRVKNALAELGISADVQKITDIKSIAARGVFSTPGLVINGTIKSSGRVPRLEEIKAWIQEKHGESAASS